MLVLNTNDGANRAIGRASNEAYKSYPDFSQILIMPSYRADRQGQTSGTISIYGVPVHSYTATIFEGEFNSGTIGSATGIGDIGGIYLNVATNTLQTYYHRVAADFKLKGGEVIGKEIKGKYYMYFGGSSSATTKTGNTITTINVYLIHQDGTTTLVNSDTHDWGDHPMSYYSSRDWGTSGYEFLSSASGTTAQAGDVIMVEIIYDITTVGGISSGYGQYMGFGRLGGTGVNDSQAYPIQISIE